MLENFNPREAKMQHLRDSEAKDTAKHLSNSVFVEDVTKACLSTQQPIWPSAANAGLEATALLAWGCNIIGLEMTRQMRHEVWGRVLRKKWLLHFPP